MRTPKEIIDAVTDAVLAYKPEKVRKKQKRRPKKKAVQPGHRSDGQ
jgi:hypothetical protein